MKNINKYISLLLFAILVFGCEEYVDDRIDFSNTFGPYVAFHDYSSVAESDVTETGSELLFRVNTSPELYEDVVVAFTFAGEAQYGTDFDISAYEDEDEDVVFTVQNKSASGFEIVIPYDITWTDSDRGYFQVIPLPDGVSDGDKTLTITMSGAETVSGKAMELARIEGQESVVITFSDVDCPSDLAGTYTATFGGFLEGTVADVVLTEQATNGVYDMDDFAGMAFGEAVPATFTDACGVISGTVELSSVAEITGTANADGSIDLQVVYGTYLWTINMVKQ